MKFYRGLGIGLSVVFGFLLLTLIAELYYLLWWKKRVTNIEMDKDDNSNHSNEVIHIGCCKRASSSQTEPRESSRKSTDSVVQEPDIELGSSKDSLQKTLGEESVDLELMRLHNLAGPPRFLFTIKEETKEDLESDDGKSKGGRSRKGSRTRSLSDLVVAIDTPLLSPLASSPLKSQSQPIDNLDAYKRHGLNPLFDSSSDLGLKWLEPSPPPKFKFLRDAEEKLYRRLTEEGPIRKSQRSSESLQESSVKTPATSTAPAEDKEGSFLKFLDHKEKAFHLHPQFPSSSSQVLTYGVLPYIVQTN